MERPAHDYKICILWSYHSKNVNSDISMLKPISVEVIEIIQMPTFHSISVQINYHNRFSHGYAKRVDDAHV